MRVLALATCGLAIVAACGTYGASDDETPSPPADGGGADGTANDGTTDLTDGGSETSPDGGRSVVVLAKNQPGAYGIAANETNVYWTDQDLGEIRTVPVSGGVVAAMATYGGAPTNLRVKADGTVTWGDQGNTPGLRRITGGASVTFLYTGPVGAFADLPNSETAVVSSKNAYLKVVDSNGDAGPGFGPYGSPTDVIPDGITAVWTASSDAQLWKVESGFASVLATNEPDCQLLAANSDGVYWTRVFEGLIRKLDRADAKSTIADSQQEPYSIAADASGVYWLTMDGAVRRWSQSGGVVTLATGQPTAINAETRVRSHSLATTSAYVVWLTGQDVRRIEK